MPPLSSVSQPEVPEACAGKSEVSSSGILSSNGLDDPGRSHDTRRDAATTGFPGAAIYDDKLVTPYLQPIQEDYCIDIAFTILTVLRLQQLPTFNL